MRCKWWPLWVILLAPVTIPVSIGVGNSQQKPKVKKTQATQTQQLGRTPVYRPPKRGAPSGRVGGGTRGPGDERPFLSVLTPDDTGLTVQEQPFLYWYISDLPKRPIEFTINENTINAENGAILKTKTLLETRLDPKRSGIQRVRLEDHKIQLSRGPAVQYEWFVSLIVDPDRRSKDDVAGGWMERVEGSPALEKKLTGAKETDLPFIYAEAGIWYDALEAISNLIDASPGNSLLRQQRAALLKQVGLTEVAAADAAR